MINYLVVVGSVTSEQYKQARLDLLRLGITPKIFRMTAAEWLMQDETKTSLDYAMSLLDGLSQDLLSSCFIPVCGGSQYLVPVDAMRVSDGELAELRGGHSTSTEAQKAFVKRYLVNDTSTVVGVVVSDDVAAEDSDGWLAIQPSDCKVYRVHADGWVESESTSY